MPNATGWARLTDTVNQTEELLRRLAAGDERCLRWALGPVTARDDSGEGWAPVLGREERALVQLAALIAVDAGTASLRWAAERAGATGVDDQTLVHVLLIVGPTAGAAQTVTSAPRLGLALDLDLEAGSLAQQADRDGMRHRL